jgi:hypothetical protein
MGEAAKLAGGNWRRADAYDLVIYDNGPAFAVDIPQALAMLRAHLAQSLQTGFQTISIITTRSSLLHGVADHCLAIAIPRC